MVETSPTPWALPEELRQFLALPRRISLQIRGGPGTGRTLLARAIVESLPGSALYLTDAYVAPPPPAGDTANGSTREVARIRDLDLDGLRQRLTKGESSEAAGTADLPSTCAVVADSWDALGEHLLGQRRRGGGADGIDNERGLFENLSRYCQRFIAVTGLGRTTAVEYLADGIVETVQSHADERAERWLRLVKLREVEMARTTYPFSLTGGRFRSFPILSESELFGTVPFDPDPEPKARSLWPGVTDLARAFGRLPSGSLTLIEADPQVSIGVQLRIVVPVILDVLREHGRVVFVPPPTLFPSEIWHRTREAFGKFANRQFAELARQKIRILSHLVGDSPDDDFGESLVGLRGMDELSSLMATPGDRPGALGGPALDSLAPRFPQLRDFLRGAGDEELNLQLVFLDGLVAAARAIGSGYTPESLASIIQRDLNQPRLHTVVVATQTDPLIRGLYALSSLHLQVVVRQGRHFVRGVRPWTTNQAIVPSAGLEGPPSPYRLLPVS